MPGGSPRVDANQGGQVDRGGDAAMSIVAEDFDFVVGVDCHAATHTFYICDTAVWDAFRKARI